MTNDLSDLEHVRQRPGMYIGDTGVRGLHECVYELVYLATSRDATRITVTLNAQGGATVSDDGLGCEPAILEQSMTDLKSVNLQAWNVSAGLHGFGCPVVNFLAMKCSVETSIAGVAFRQSYCRGVAETPVKRIGTTTNSGMAISILPDPEIFNNIQLRSDLIAKRLQELSYLRVGIWYAVVDERTLEKIEFFSEDGSQDFVHAINDKTEKVHPVITLKGHRNGIQFDIAFQYNTTFREQTTSFGNDFRSAEGGMHVLAFKRSLMRILKRAGDQQGIPLPSIEESSCYFDGLTSVVAVRLDNPLWHGASKTRLANEELYPVITEAMDAHFQAYLESSLTTTLSILRKVQQSALSRIALPPIDSNQFHRLEKRLTKPEEDPNGWGTTAWLPSSYQRRMERRNGGEVQTQNELWKLFPIRDESNEVSLQRTKCGVTERTERSHGTPGIPNDAVVIAQNQKGDLLLFIRRTDRPCGEDYPNPFAGEVYRWDHASHELARIADDFDEICWGPDVAKH